MPTIIEMVGHTRLDCVIGIGRRHALGGRQRDLARRPPRGLRQAAGRPAADANVLADLAIESEAATALAMRLARAYDEDDVLLRRLATAVGKF